MHLHIQNKSKPLNPKPQKRIPFEFDTVYLISGLGQVAERLAAVASRLGGSELGLELRDVSAELRPEIGSFKG